MRTALPTRAVFGFSWRGRARRCAGPAATWSGTSWRASYERPARLHAVNTPIDLGRPSEGSLPPQPQRSWSSPDQRTRPRPLESSHWMRRRAGTAIGWGLILVRQVHFELVPERVAAGPPQRRAPGRHEQLKTARIGRGAHRLREPSQAAQAKLAAESAGCPNALRRGARDCVAAPRFLLLKCELHGSKAGAMTGQ